MSELDEIKRRKLEELQKRQQGAMQQQADEQAQMQQQIEQLENVVKSILTKEALSRYGNLKSAHPKTAMQLLVAIGQAVQAGQISKIDDNKLKEILQKISEKKKEFRIIRK